MEPVQYDSVRETQTSGYFTTSSVVYKTYLCFKIVSFQNGYRKMDRMVHQEIPRDNKRDSVQGEECHVTLQETVTPSVRS